MSIFVKCLLTRDDQPHSCSHWGRLKSACHAPHWGQSRFLIHSVCPNSDLCNILRAILIHQTKNQHSYLDWTLIEVINVWQYHVCNSLVSKCLRILQIFKGLVIFENKIMKTLDLWHILESYNARKSMLTVCMFMHTYIASTYHSHVNT